MAIGFPFLPKYADRQTDGWTVVKLLYENEITLIPNLSFSCLIFLYRLLLGLQTLHDDMLQHRPTDTEMTFGDCDRRIIIIISSAT